MLDGVASVGNAAVSMLLVDQLKELNHNLSRALRFIDQQEEERQERLERSASLRVQGMLSWSPSSVEGWSQTGEDHELMWQRGFHLTGSHASLQILNAEQVPVDGDESEIIWEIQSNDFEFQGTLDLEHFEWITNNKLPTVLPPTDKD